MSKDTSGPAFPVLIVDRPKELTHFNGMTLRDYFAAKAVQGMLSNQNPYRASDEHIFARDAYKVADAMLKARQQ